MYKFSQSKDTFSRSGLLKTSTSNAHHPMFTLKNAQWMNECLMLVCASVHLPSCISFYFFWGSGKVYCIVQCGDSDKDVWFAYGGLYMRFDGGWHQNHWRRSYYPISAEITGHAPAGGPTAQRQYGEYHPGQVVLLAPVLYSPRWSVQGSLWPDGISGR